MSSKGRIDDIVDVPAVKKQIDYLKTELDVIIGKFGVYASALEGVNKNVKAASGMSDLNKSLKEQAVLTETVAKNANTYNEVQKKLAAETAKLTSLNNGGAAKYKELVKAQIQVKETKAKINLEAEKEVNANKKVTGSMKEMEAELKLLTAQYKALSAADRNSSSGLKLQQKIADTKGELNQMNETLGNSTGFVGKYQRIWEGLGTYIATATGIFAGVWASIKVGEQAINSSQYATDQWKVTVAGLTSGWNEFMNSIANWDFSNLIDRLNEAVKAGREYAELIDLLEKKQKGLSTQHKQENEEIARLRLSYYDHNKTASEKAAIMEQVIKLTQKQAEEDAALAKQSYDSYVNTIIQQKGIAKSTLESYLQFKGTTEEKVQLIEKLKNAENYYNANVGILGETDPGVQRAWKTMIDLRVKGVGEYARLETRLNDEQIQKARDLYDAVATTNAAVYENKEGFYRKMELQFKKEDAAQVKSGKAVEKTVEELKKLRDEYERIDMLNTSAPIFNEIDKRNENIAAIEKEIEDRKVIAKLIADEEAALLALSDAQAAADVSKSQGNKTQAALSSLPRLTASQQFGQMTDKERRDYAIEQAGQVADAAFTIMANSSNAEFDYKMSLLDKQREAELANKHLTERQKAAINEKYAKQEAKLKEQQFKKQKAADIIQSIINTALAVTKALPNIPLAIAAGVAGAAQTAIIAAQPIPKYFKGREGGPAEWAIVGERGTEAIQLPSGKTMLTPPEETMMFLPKGANVIPNHDLLKLSQKIPLGSIPVYDGGISANDIKSLKAEIANLNNGFAMVVNAVKNKKELHAVFDQNGVNAFIQNGSSRADYVNSNIRF